MNFANRMERLGTETAFRINVNGLAFGPAVRDGHLARDAQGVAELGLAGAELSKDFRNGSRLNAPTQELVEFDRSGAQREEGAVL